jgi:hypothetical protein
VRNLLKLIHNHADNKTSSQTTGSKQETTGRRGIQTYRKAMAIAGKRDESIFGKECTKVGFSSLFPPFCFLSVMFHVKPPACTASVTRTHMIPMFVVTVCVVAFVWWFNCLMSASLQLKALCA